MLKKTLESISLDRRRGYDERDYVPEEIVKRLSETGNEGVESVTLNEEWKPSNYPLNKLKSKKGDLAINSKSFLLKFTRSIC